MIFRKGQYVKIKHKPRNYSEKSKVWIIEFLKMTEGKIGIITGQQIGTDFNILVNLLNGTKVGIPSNCLKKATIQEIICEAL